jgi:sulfoxide reductase heme-binding subunit YedZ
MSITEPIQLATLEQTVTTTSKRPITFPELFVVLNGCLPLAMLIYDAKHHHLGPNPISNGLHTTGLVSMLLLIATLCVSPVIKLTKLQQLFYYRRPLGLLAFLYAIAHVAIYVVYDRAWNYQEAWSEVVARRYLQLGALAVMLMLPLAITSTPFWVWCLGFRRWKSLHRLIYPAAIAAVVHYILQARAEIKLPLAMGSAVVGLLLYRVLSASRELQKKRHAPKIDEAIGCYLVDFADEGISHYVHPETTLLEAASELGLNLDSDCQAGVCGTCRIQLIKGDVIMEVDSGLSKKDRASHIILACQAKCCSDVTVRRIDRP